MDHRCSIHKGYIDVGVWKPGVLEDLVIWFFERLGRLFGIVYMVRLEWFFRTTNVHLR